MSISRKITHLARYVPSNLQFTASFSGIYNFSVSGNENVNLFSIDKGSVYYLDTYTVSANIASEDFLSSRRSDLTLTLKYQHTGQSIYARPIILSQLLENKPCNAFVMCDNFPNAILATLTGSLNQIASTVGLSSLILNVAFSIYAIDEGTYNKEFRDRTFEHV